RAGDKRYVRILLLEHSRKYLVPLDVLGTPLFVANANHLEVEGRRMAQLGPLTAPLTGGGRVRKLNQIDCVLNEMIEIFKRGQLARIELAGHAAIQNWQRLSADIFAKLKVFVVAEAERLVIVRRRTPVEFCVPAIDDEAAVVQSS